MVTAVVPLLVRITDWATLLVLNGCKPKFRLVAEKVILALAPVPLRPTVCGAVKSASLTLSKPVRGPVALGRNVMLMTHWPPAPTEVPQLLVWVQSDAPVSSIAPIGIGVLAWFVKVTFFTTA